MNITIITQRPETLAFVTYILAIIDQQLNATTSPRHFETVYIVHDSVFKPFDAIMKTLEVAARYPLPLKVVDFEHAPQGKPRINDESRFFIFLFASVDSFSRLGNIRESFNMPLTKNVFLLDNSATLDTVETAAIATLNPLQRYVLIRPNGDILLQLRLGMVRLSVNLTDFGDTRNRIDRMQELILDDLMSARLTVFVHYSAHYGLVTPIGDAANSLECIGLDALMTHAIMRQLHATPLIVTDAARVNANFRNESNVVNAAAFNRMQPTYSFYHSRILQHKPTTVFDFNM